MVVYGKITLQPIYQASRDSCLIDSWFELREMGLARKKMNLMLMCWSFLKNLLGIDEKLAKEIEDLLLEDRCAVVLIWSLTQYQYQLKTYGKLAGFDSLIFKSTVFSKLLRVHND